MHYSAGNYSGLSKLLTAVTRELRPHADEYDAIVCTGISGLVVASPLSVRLKKPLMVLRKSGEECHGAGGLIGFSAMYKRVLFVDDFIGSGTTRAKCMQAVHERGLGVARVVAQYEYAGHCGGHAKGWRTLP